MFTFFSYLPPEDSLISFFVFPGAFGFFFLKQDEHMLAENWGGGGFVPAP